MSFERIVVLTGAGLSAESGLGTFRGKDGLWDTYNVEELATPEASRAIPPRSTTLQHAPEVARGCPPQRGAFRPRQTRARTWRQGSDRDTEY
ncbi:Sir2 family NAD-dependent protein deacetylase [Methyloceanibacter stevinii]|uniref:Sir2 family NAD-dependent protein deacetylase n=1 Tax=Methyloceanibacter stevinii TaxID=1774970 RepID=UPI0031392E57